MNYTKISKPLLNRYPVFPTINKIPCFPFHNTGRQKKFSLQFFIVLFFVIAAGLMFSPLLAAQLTVPSDEKYTQDAALRMIASSQGSLKPVYKPLAEQIVADYNLAGRSSGIGIDLGSGPGNLILELCEHTELHWINADINPYFFAHFYSEAEKRGFGHRVSAVFADAQFLPFRDNYADIIVSRGSYHFWEKKEQAFSEIFRVLKPGGIAFIGRGFARNMPVNVARSVRENQKNFPGYDPQTEAKQLEGILQRAHIRSFRIERPVPAGSEGLNYGIWIEIRK